MDENLKNEKAIREYLLGRVSDETLLADYEELLFLNEEFCSLAEIVEDELVNDFVFAKLSATEREDFEKTLPCNPERREKIALTKAIKEKVNLQTFAEKETKPSFFESVGAFFKKPLNIGAFAVLMIGVLVLSFFLLNRPKTDELAELKTIYIKERPTETRISAFDYAPLTVTRGEREEREKNKLRIIENELRIAVEKSPSANTHHALGVFLLTQRNFTETISELKKAVKLNEKDAAIRNDLGSAYFEKAKTEPDEKKLQTLAQALENFSQAVESDAQFLPALFNKSLCLQELRLYNQAKESWNLYLEKDGNSGWAIEARKNLERLEQLKSTSKTKEQVLEDFLAAYRARDDETTWKINSQTREMISGVWLPDQLSRRFIEAKIRGDDAQATESIEALKYIGNLEREKNADFFVVEMADFYSQADKNCALQLSKAKDLMRQGLAVSIQAKHQTSKQMFAEASRIFAANQNLVEKQVADYWVAFSESFSGEILSGNDLLTDLDSTAQKKNYKWFRAVLLMLLSINSYKQNNHSLSIKHNKDAIALFEEIGDSYNGQRASSEMAVSYAEFGEFEKALKYLSKAILTQNLYFQSQKQEWRMQGYASDILQNLQFRYSSIESALEYLNTAKTNNISSEDVFYSLIALSSSYANMQNFGEALKLAEESRKTAESFGDEKAVKLAVADSTLQIAQVKRLGGNCIEALSDYDSAIKINEEFSARKVSEYMSHKGKLGCFRQLGQTRNSQSELEIVRGLLEKYRSEIVEEENRNAFFDKEQSVAEIAVEFELANKNPAKAFEIAEEVKARSLLDFMQGEVSFEKNEVRFSSVTKNLALTEIQKRMPPSVQIVEYAVLPDKIAVWIVGKESFEYSETPIKAEILEQKIGDYLQTLITEKDDSEASKTKSNELYELLIAPILSKLDAQKQICFVPDKSLYRLPFAALFSSAKNKYLVEDWTIFYAPSSSIFVIASENARQKEVFKDESLLSVGNPKFDASENPKLNDLPAAETEAKKITEFYPKNQRFIGESATKANILKDLTGRSVFHFAGHYVTNEASTPNSKLLLTKQDGDLRLAELAEKRLPKTKLVVLSACQTNAEKVFQGEGAIGIARTFLAIGSPTVLASGWQVESEAAKDLMIAFHRSRKEKGLKNAEALRAAQIEMLKGENARFRTPYFWSAFSLVGGFTNY